MCSSAAQITTGDEDAQMLRSVYQTQGRKRGAQTQTLTCMCIVYILNTTKCTSSSKKILLLFVKDFQGSLKSSRQGNITRKYHTWHWGGPFVQTHVGHSAPAGLTSLKYDHGHGLPVIHKSKQITHKNQGESSKSGYSILNFHICIRSGPSGLTPPPPDSQPDCKVSVFYDSPEDTHTQTNINKSKTQRWCASNSAGAGVPLTIRT